MIPAAHREAIALAARQELARRRLIDFAELCVPNFTAARHLRLLAELLERVERCELQRLIVTLHPGSGKSTLLQAFVPWLLGRNPARRIITVSNGADLAETNSAASRAILLDSSWPFAEVELRRDTTAKSRWATTKGGGLYAVGVQGQITGNRANGAIICDDLQNDAGSLGERTALWEWFTNVLVNRADPGTPIVIVQQRWSEDDVVGRALDAPDGAAWHVVRLPALAEENDPLGRGVGESLWPEVYSAEELQRRRASNSRMFECQYQGNPIPLEGNLIRREWLQRYTKAPTEFHRVVVAIDAAAKTGVRNDYSVILKLGVTHNAFYVLDVWRSKVDFPTLLRRVRDLEIESPAPSTIYVEDTSNAVAMIQALREESRLPIVAVSAKGSKESRVEGITGVLEAKRLYLPEEAPWLLDFERELLSFPAGKHDDQVDALTLGISQTFQRLQSWSFSFGEGVDDDLEINGSRAEGVEWERRWTEIENARADKEEAERHGAAT